MPLLLPASPLSRVWPDSRSLRRWGRGGVRVGGWWQAALFTEALQREGTTLPKIIQQPARPDSRSESPPPPTPAFSRLDTLKHICRRKHVNTSAHAQTRTLLVCVAGFRDVCRHDSRHKHRAKCLRTAIAASLIPAKLPEEDFCALGEPQRSSRHIKWGGQSPPSPLAPPTPPPLHSSSLPTNAESYGTQNEP